MKKQQHILTLIIVLAVIGIAVVIASIIYDEKIKDNKKAVETISAPQVESKQTDDEKAIELAKKEWGDDGSVSFSIEEKKDKKIYVAVKQDATVIQWYEVDTSDWTISEY